MMSEFLTRPLDVRNITFILYAFEPDYWMHTELQWVFCTVAHADNV